MYAGVMGDWLSFWNKEQREQNKVREPFTHIYIAYGEQRISRRDKVYCVGIQDGDLHLFTRVEVAKLENDDDPDHVESILAFPKSKIITDYQLAVPLPCLKSLRYLRVGSSIPCPVKLTGKGKVVPMQFRGPASLRELVQGAGKLDSLFASKSPSAPRSK
jgi:hypothetical protein